MPVCDHPFQPVADLAAGVRVNRHAFGMDAADDFGLVGQHEPIVLPRRDEAAAGEGRGNQHGVDAPPGVLDAQVGRALGVRRQNRLAPLRLVDQVHQRFLIAEQLHQLREGREDFAMDGKLLAHLGLDQLDRAEEIVGPVAGAIGLVRIEAVIERILQAAQVVRIVVIEPLGIDFLDLWPATALLAECDARCRRPDSGRVRRW